MPKSIDMNDSADYQTSPTLLGRLQANPVDQTAWLEFEGRYGDMIRRWCRRWGLQSSDADDLAQDVLLALSKQMRRFEYDPSHRFRAWLKTIAHRSWCDFLEARRRRAVGSGETSVIELLERHDLRDDFSAQLEREWQKELLESSMRSVQLRVQPQTWEAFRLLTLEGLSGIEVAERMNMKLGAVWVAGSRVRHLIQQEIRRLDSIESIS